MMRIAICYVGIYFSWSTKYQLDYIGVEQLMQAIYPCNKQIASLVL